MKSTDLDKFREGEESKFNSSFATLERMNQALKEANYWSSFVDFEGMKLWLAALRSLHRELSPFMNKEEKDLLEKIKISSITRKKVLINYYYDLLDKYESALRDVHTSKGFGIKAEESDPLVKLMNEVN